MVDNRTHKRSKVLKDVGEIRNLKEMLKNTKEKFGDENAFVFKTETPDVFRYITYNEYIDDINAFGTAMVNSGLKGKRIAIISENRYEWMLTYLAVTCGTGIVSPLDKSLQKEELISSINRSEVEAIVYSKKYEDIMKEINGNSDNKVRFFISMDKEENESHDNMCSLKEFISKGKKLIAGGNRSYLDCKINNEEPAIMLFTSRNYCYV